MKTERRSILKKLVSSVVGISGLGLIANAKAEEAAPEKEAGNITTSDDVPLFSGHTKFGNMVFIAGKGWHEGTDIRVHTDETLKALEKELILAGSSMKKVLKVSVFLNDINDYAAMNEVYKGRFGDKPPVRTTVAVAQGGVPGKALVEMDAIAYI